MGRCWPVEACSRWVDLDGPTHYLDFGGPPEGPVVVCLHGLRGSALHWGLAGPHLTGRARVLAVDLVGHGKLRWPAVPRQSEIDEIFAGGEDLATAIERVARPGTQLLLQAALEAEVTAFLGRERYQWAATVPEAAEGMRNGYARSG